MLADFGAEVIKIEPPSGDPYRHRTGGPNIPESPFNYRWIVDNRTKRALSLDLRQPEGREVLHRLARRADVPPRYAPELGEHSSAILAEVGYSEAEIDRLLADSVVVQDKPAAG